MVRTEPCRGYLELFAVAVRRVGVLGSAVYGQAMAKRVTEQAGIPQCRWIEFRDGIDDACEIVGRAIDALGLPLFVKPANLGSSVGISKAHNNESELDKAIDVALRYDDTVIIEEAVTAREIEVAVWATPPRNVGARRDPARQRLLRLRGQVRDRRREAGDPRRPARRRDREGSGAGRRVVSRAALRRPGPRRLLLRGGRRGWLLNEINTIPGFTPGLDVPETWDAAGSPVTPTSSTGSWCWHWRITAAGPGSPPNTDRLAHGRRPRR